MLDLFPQVGVLAKLCISNNHGYFSICQNKTQRDWLEDELTNDVLSEMANPSSRLYSHAYGKCSAATAHDAKNADAKKCKKALRAWMIKRAR